MKVRENVGIIFHVKTKGKTGFMNNRKGRWPIMKWKDTE